MDFPVTRPQKKVVLFPIPTCSWCRRAKAYLTEKKVQFKATDVSRG